MDSIDQQNLNWENLNICCCCLKDGCVKNVCVDYSNSGQKEIYEVILKETFDIQILHPSKTADDSRYICEECILQLRSASTFKRIVLNSEKTFAEYLDSLEANVIALQTDSTIKEETVPMDMTFEDQDGISNDHSDDETLSSYITEPTRMSSEESHPRNHRGRREKLRKCKIKKENRDEPKTAMQKDWARIAERRGNGPILRDNSLKLLANSTICVFQWNKSRYRCFCCNEPFSDLSTLRDHTNTSHSLQEIEKKIILQQNRLVKVEVSYISCKLCSLQLETLAELRDHLRENHGIRFTLNEDLLVPFKIGDQLQCQICHETFAVFRLLNMHMNKHFQKQVCHICGSGFSNLVFLNLHKTRSHRPLACKLCNLAFNTRAEKRTHDACTHGVKVERKLRFPCPYCQERFLQENFRVLHLVEKHGMVRPEHKCSVCLKSFLTKSLRNNHMKNVHLKEKNHECDVCHNLFYTKSDVLRHRVTHTGEKKFCCGICNNTFATKDSLRRHGKRTHVGMR